VFIHYHFFKQDTLTKPFGALRTVHPKLTNTNSRR
jgi:hypothetical protein